MTDKQNLIKEIESIIKSAKHAIDTQDWLAANTLLKDGLSILGNRYRSPKVIDDTGMHLIMANESERKGQLKDAATLRMDILQVRFDQFKSNP
jgi:hypothetical protein